MMTYYRKLTDDEMDDWPDEAVFFDDILMPVSGVLVPASFLDEVRALCEGDGMTGKQFELRKKIRDSLAKLEAGK